MIYIANDVESAGGKLGVHSSLSIGAAVVTPESIPFEEYWSRGLVFYAELKPDSLIYDEEAMRVGCLHLICLDNIKKEDPRFDATSPKFSSYDVLTWMQENCEMPAIAISRFVHWIESFRNVNDRIRGITDTVFFDGGRIDSLFGRWHHGNSPYGWSGLDLDSVYRGYMRDRRARLEELGVPDERTKPHRADHDAVYLAQQARVLLYEKMEG